MENYRKILFEHLDGIVLIPTIINLKKTGILNIISDKVSFTINDINKHKEVNIGYLNISLRTLRNCNLLDFKKNKYYLDSKYKININFIKLFNNLDILKKIHYLISFYIRIDNLTNDDIKKFSKEISEFMESIENKNFKYSYLEGILIGPLLAKLSFKKKINIKNNEIQYKNIDIKLKNTFDLIFNSLNIIKGNKITNKGNYFIKKASAYGVTVSYLNTLNNIDKLILTNPNYIWQRTKNNTEIHVDRSLNVWGSGGAHKNYFKKIDKIIIKIFNKPLNEQPKGIIDIGCGDGTFLKHLFRLIIKNTIRGKSLNEKPLLVIGTDINKKARNAARNTLMDINHLILDGDISNPASLYSNLLNDYNLRLEDLLNCRTFLDHNRIYKKPSKHFLKHNINTNGGFAYKGEFINSKNIIANFIEHLYNWKPYIKKHGLIIIELHTIDSEITKISSGKTLSCSYDATHGYTDQYLIEYDNYIKCFNHIGLKKTNDNEYLYPKNNPTVSINYITQ